MISYRIIQSFDHTTSQKDHGYENISNPNTYPYVSRSDDDDSINELVKIFGRAWRRGRSSRDRRTRRAPRGGASPRAGPREARSSPTPRARRPSPLDAHCNALANADAERSHAALRVARAHRVEERHEDSTPACHPPGSRNAAVCTRAPISTSAPVCSRCRSCVRCLTCACATASLAARQA